MYLATGLTSQLLPQHLCVQSTKEPTSNPSINRAIVSLDSKKRRYLLQTINLTFVPLFRAMEGTAENPHGPLPDNNTVIAQMWTNKRVLSPIWGELPIELVQKIFNSLIESYISGCFFNDECTFDDDGHLVEISPNWASIGTARSLQAWELRHQTLFRRQRHLIERHFQDEWLSRMTLYLCLDAEFDTPFLRYFHFPESEDCIRTKVRVNPDDKKATFFLYRPELSGFVTEGDITLEEMMEDLVNAWDDYRGQRTTSYLIVGIRSKSLQREERYWNRLMDMYNTPKGAVNLEGLEVSEDGRQIRFNWEDFITAMVTWQLHESMRADLAGEL